MSNLIIGDNLEVLKDGTHLSKSYKLIYLDPPYNTCTNKWNAVRFQMGIYLGFIIAFAAVLILLRFLCRIPDYIFRKLLHIVAFTLYKERSTLSWRGPAYVT